MEHHGYQINYTVGYSYNMRRIHQQYIIQYTFWNGKGNKHLLWADEYYIELFIRRFKNKASGNNFYDWLFQ